MPAPKDTPIVMKIEQNRSIMHERLGIGKSFDVGCRTLNILGHEVDLYYVNGLCESPVIVNLLRQLFELNEGTRDKKSAFKHIYNDLAHQQVEVEDKIEKCVTQVLSGLIAIFVEGEAEAIIVDVRAYPGRTPEEPDTEKVVRGSRDGYTENIIENTALTRRRIRDDRLRNELLQVGKRSKTDICISYIQDVADPGLIQLIKDELQQIDIDGLSMADKSIEEFLVKQGYNPFPLVRYTERPDIASAHLLEGHVIIMVDTSPSMIITPTTYFHHVQHAEEYRQSPAVGTFIRWVRFFGLFSSVFLLPLWMLFVIQPDLLPESLDFIGPNEESTLPIIIQLLIADLGIEMLRIAAIHTPTPLSTAMGLIAAVLIGQIAIDVGLFVPEVILYVAVSAIGSYATPSYELSVSNKMSRLTILGLAALFGLSGFVIGCTLYILLLARTKSLNTPYLWPFLPFNAKAFGQILVRMSVPLGKIRPSIVHPQNNHRQR
ncbi:stage V sporulation protein AF [Halobacillus andaensis]|uniref:Stage V sporulation protein AF n=1 Tax=Halobacillus andaensis TaxID=1176239 RepID=A0A917AZF2_HALAA|nr:stage V sporulation protein AF [Halobacillus andaensis]GGF08921.1 stage V sporulation protein AF [Halobacillus andaensis]